MSLTEPQEKWVWSELHRQYYRAKFNRELLLYLLSMSYSQPFTDGTQTWDFQDWHTPAPPAPGAANSGSYTTYGAVHGSYHQAAQSSNQWQGTDSAYNSPFQTPQSTNSSNTSESQARGLGQTVEGTYHGPGTLHYEQVDPSENSLTAPLYMGL
jgi:hypothetical protein